MLACKEAAPHEKTTMKALSRESASHDFNEVSLTYETSSRKISEVYIYIYMMCIYICNQSSPANTVIQKVKLAPTTLSFVRLFVCFHARTKRTLQPGH